jgi:hypothetical protein
MILAGMILYQGKTTSLIDAYFKSLQEKVASYKSVINMELPIIG